MEELAWTLLPGVIAVAIESIRKDIAPQFFGRGQWKLAQ
jgi:hypothetical protein